MEPDIRLYQHDLPDDLDLGEEVAIDTEAMGLNPHRDRLCLVQLSSGNGVCHLVQRPLTGQKPAPNLTKLLNDPKVLKLFHFARFDVGLLQHTFNVSCSPVYCTKIASKLCRTFLDRHGLKDLCRDLLGVEISKTQQVSDWGRETLSDEQLAYAASDVLYLHRLKEKLDTLLKRENRDIIAQKCFDFLPTCTDLDLMGFNDLSVFRH
tara:strand:+ start:642 stop:1262 length:621 start_codon:yes stop_codon:yes gene_type:complete